MAGAWWSVRYIRSRNRRLICSMVPSWMPFSFMMRNTMETYSGITGIAALAWVTTDFITPT